MPRYYGYLFLSASELRISADERRAALKLLSMMETGKLRVPRSVKR